MDRAKIHPLAKSINLRANSKKEFFLIHGYTGSPTDFNQLPYYLHKKFNANVKIPRLRGHGTNVKNLGKLNYRDFFNQIEKELEKDIKNGKEIVLIGISLGAFIAFQLSAKYKVKGVIAVSPMYKYKFPFNFLSIIEPIIFKKIWKKPIPEYEKELRKNSFSYEVVHGRGFRVIRQAKREIKKYFKMVKVPYLIIGSKKDMIVDYRGFETIKKMIGSKNVKMFIFDSKKKANHNLFYSPHHNEVYKIIEEFIKKI